MIFGSTAVSLLRYLALLFLLSRRLEVWGMSRSEKRQYREKTLEMFLHGYNAYMDHAYPADELMPLSCKGRVRGREPSRGDIDDCLGSFSLTLIDTLDSLAVLGLVEEFSNAIKLVIRDVQFDADLIVSVFETNIRILGGLLGAHFAAETLKAKGEPALLWYNGQLVDMADRIGQKLLPAFNTTTGLPYSRINLRHGINGTHGHRVCGDTTCTACAGTMIMEFAALSRVTGNREYELKAHQAMEVLWQQRHQQNNLVGSIINVQNGQWARKDSGVGAGIDSYYEYCLKTYVLLGEEEYLNRFDAHYSAVMRYISSGPLLLDVNMNQPLRPPRRFMDALLAFWPGLQVLWGDVSSAVHTHDMLYHVMQRHKFIPEAFTTEFNVHWPQHPLRPEFVESTYFLYQATEDPYYLEVGRTVVDNLDRYARVKCGFAAFKDVRNNQHEDKMDSFVLAETFKYLYLLFSEEEETILDMDEFVFTTEAHILPLSLRNQEMGKRARGKTSKPHVESRHQTLSPTCPRHNLSAKIQKDSYRRLMLNQCSVLRFSFKRKIVELEQQHKDALPKEPKMKLRDIDFGNLEHLQLLTQMGITFHFQDGGKVMLAHDAQKADSYDLAEDGRSLIQEVIRLMQLSANNTDISRETKILQILEPELEVSSFMAGPAMFGPDIGGEHSFQVSGDVVVASSPVDGCEHFDDEDLYGKIVLIVRGGCMFIHKVRNAQAAGAMAAIIYDNKPKENDTLKFPFSMSSDGNDNVVIPSVFVEEEVGHLLIDLIDKGKRVNVLLTWPTEELVNQLNSVEHSSPTPPTPIGPTQAPSVTDHQPSKPTEQDSKEECTNKVLTSSSSQEVPVEKEEEPVEEEAIETAGCLASDSLFECDRKDGKKEHGENSVDDERR